MIHKFSMNGLNLVMDINSGAIHVLDDAAYCVADDVPHKTDAEIITAWADRFSEEELREALSELRLLIRQGDLYAPDIYETLDYAPAPVIKALCLHIAHDCNLRCRYCFAGKGDYRGPRGLMTADVGRQAVDFLLAHSGSRQNLEIDFFGGEPTLNFGVVKEIVAYGREREKQFQKNIRFTLTTNGLLLDDEMLAFVNKHMQNVVLSADGRKEIHDRMRPRAGVGSYDAVVPKLQKLAESRGQENYYVRGTYTRENLDFSEDVLHLADLGFQRISVEPVVADSAEDYALRDEDLPVLFQQYETLAQIMRERAAQGRPFQFFHFMIDLAGGPCVYKRMTGCGAGMEYLSVTPTGELYPCHQFVGLEQFRMGDLKNGAANPELRGQFAQCNVYAKEECARCWAKFYCSGGCAASAYYQNGDIMRPYALGCALQKKRIECAVYLAAASELENIDRANMDRENAERENY
ncbi:MAG: thioether cross-link-forming SCIFF peptide maturase [Clostridiales bacterium]|nr:thioether cross-link-forming SCIFF peptide maturase [Clostridiales bacterium]